LRLMIKLKISKPLCIYLGLLLFFLLRLRLKPTHRLTAK
jgi:hypothetical protein